MRCVSWAAFALLALFLVSVPAVAGAPDHAESLVTSGVGLNYIGEGQCLVTNSDAVDHTVHVRIFRGMPGTKVADELVTVMAGQQATVSYQAGHADLQDYFCTLNVPGHTSNGITVLSGIPGGIRMSFRRIDFLGNVSSESDGLRGAKRPPPAECPCVPLWTNGTGAPNIETHAFQTPNLLDEATCKDGEQQAEAPVWLYGPSQSELICVDGIDTTSATDRVSTPFESPAQLEACAAYLERLCVEADQ